MQINNINNINNIFFSLYIQWLHLKESSYKN